MLHGTGGNFYSQAWLLRQMRTLGLDAAKVAKLRKRASLYTDEKAVSPKSKPIIELLYLSRECQSVGAMFVRPSCVATHFQVQQRPRTG